MLSALLLSLLLSVGCQEQKPAPGPPVVPVVLGPVLRGAVEIRLTLAGELRSTAEFAIQTETVGTVQAIPTRLGAAVEAGTLLVQLDERPARIAQAAAQARLLQAQAELRGRRADLALKQSELDRALAVDATRPEALSAQERMDLQNRVEQAVASALSAEALEQLRKAELQAAHLEVERCRIRSPLAGVLSQQTARPGQRVVAGTALGEVVATGRLEALLELGEAQSGAVSPGAAVRLRLPARAGKDEGAAFEGVIGGVVTAASSGSRNQRLRVDVEQPPAGWLPGMAVEASVSVVALSEAIRVPRDALFNGAVFTVVGGKAHRIVVQVRHDQGAELIVSSVGADLEGAAEVVVRGNEALQDGTPVSPAGEPAAPAEPIKKAPSP